MLIDSGSTNSFIDLLVLQKVRIRPTRTYYLVVTVDNGNKTVSRDESQLSWEMQNQKFSADLGYLSLQIIGWY